MVRRENPLHRRAAGAVLAETGHENRAPNISPLNIIPGNSVIGPNRLLFPQTAQKGQMGVSCLGDPSKMVGFLSFLFERKSKEGSPQKSSCLGLRERNLRLLPSLVATGAPTI